MKKYARILTAALMASMLLVGCGKDVEVLETETVETVESTVEETVEETVESTTEETEETLETATETTEEETVEETEAEASKKTAKATEKTAAAENTVTPAETQVNEAPVAPAAPAAPVAQPAYATLEEYLANNPGYPLQISSGFGTPSSVRAEGNMVIFTYPLNYEATWDDAYWLSVSLDDYYTSPRDLVRNLEKASGINDLRVKAEYIRPSGSTALYHTYHNEGTDEIEMFN